MELHHEQARTRVTSLSHGSVSPRAVMTSPGHAASHTLRKPRKAATPLPQCSVLPPLPSPTCNFALVPFLQKQVKRREVTLDATEITVYGKCED